MKREQFSKKVTRWVFMGGLVIIQECLFLIAYAIYKDFTATAAYLTAAIAVAEGMIMVVAHKYLGFAEATQTGSSAKSGEGITYATAKAKEYVEKEPEI